MAKYVAYQTWQRPSYMNGPRYEDRVYGEGSTPDEAIHDALFEERNGETWQKRNAPNRSDLRVKKVA